MAPGDVATIAPERVRINVSVGSRGHRRRGRQIRVFETGEQRHRSPEAPSSAFKDLSIHFISIPLIHFISCLNDGIFQRQFKAWQTRQDGRVRARSRVINDGVFKCLVLLAIFPW
jgi:hypothetical protein